MLKIEYPCRELFSSYENQAKPKVTWAQAKKHLHDVRFRRQNQLASNISECHRLHQLHKQLFDRYCELKPIEKPIEKPPDNKQNKPKFNDYCNYGYKYSTPRMEYASIIYRKSVPTFEVESTQKSDDEIPIVRELTQYLSESTFAVSNDKREKFLADTHQLSSNIQSHDQHRRLSVSSVSSQDKRANKVYEKWPDYNEISEIVGYRIDPPQPKADAISITVSRPAATRGQRKRSAALGFPMASKQIKTMISLNPSTSKQKGSKTKQPTKPEPIPITADKAFDSTDPILACAPTMQEDKLKLPSFLCPSSAAYSSRTLTRQWLMKNNFSSYAPRTIPLV